MKTSRRAPVSLLLGAVLSSALAACASPRAGAPAVTSRVVSPPYELTVEVSDPPRRGQVTEDDVAASLRARERDLAECYLRERLADAASLSDYRFELRIPGEGRGHRVAVLEATRREDVALEVCLAARLEALELPMNNGWPLVVQVVLGAPAEIDGASVIRSVEAVGAWDLALR